jgi:hypothetical protein
MWIRHCELVAGEGEHLPIPTRIASNEEFVPPGQTREQQLLESEAWAIVERAANRLGVSRRDFLRSSCGMAAGILALNRVFGDCFDVDENEVVDPQKIQEKWPKDQFIFDIQTHHVDVGKKWYDDTPEGRQTTRFFRSLRPGTSSLEESLDQLNRDHYVKEIFFDSDTVMAVISGVPSREWDKNPLPPDLMAATRDYVNGLAGSQRVLSHGLLRPNLGARELDEMERQVKDLKIAAWKMYTGAELGENAWWMDDEKVAYPCWEKSRKLGIRNLCVHKGLPLGFFNEEHCKPKDLLKAAKDWPELNFIVYHSAFRGLGEMREASAKDPQEIPWTSDLVRTLREHPEVKNIYFELGSTFGQISAFAPVACMHLLGQMLQCAGPDRILWGTDSIWGGSPQGQIERLRRLKMRDDLIEKYGYPPITPEVKKKILGLNAARLFGVDVEAKRSAITRDQFSKIRCAYERDPWPSNVQFGWVWKDEGSGAEPTVPIGPAPERA